jgi:hypothetical protein
MNYADLIPWWCLVGFTSGWFAQRRGRVGRTWFALGLLLGPIALGILLLSRPPSATDENHETDPV